MSNKSLPGFVWYHLSEEEEQLLAQPVSLVIQHLAEYLNYKTNTTQPPNMLLL